MHNSNVIIMKSLKQLVIINRLQLVQTSQLGQIQSKHFALLSSVNLSEGNKKSLQVYICNLCMRSHMLHT